MSQRNCPAFRSAATLGATSRPEVPNKSTEIPYFFSKSRVRASRMVDVTSEITDTLPSFFAAATVLSHSAARLAELKPKSAITMRTSILTTARFITAPPMRSTILEVSEDSIYHYSLGGECILAHLHRCQGKTRITKRPD